MSKHLGDFAVGATINFKFTTKDAAGAPITLAGDPLIRIFKDSSTSYVTVTSLTLTVDFAGITGLHHVAVNTLGVGTPNLAGEYFAVLMDGTVSGVSQAGTVLASFSLGRTAQMVRDAMKLAPSAGDPAAGSVDALLGSTILAPWEARPPVSAYGGGSHEAGATPAQPFRALLQFGPTDTGLTIADLTVTLDEGAILETEGGGPLVEVGGGLYWLWIRYMPSDQIAYSAVITAQPWKRCSGVVRQQHTKQNTIRNVLAALIQSEIMPCDTWTACTLTYSGTMEPGATITVGGSKIGIHWGDGDLELTEEPLFRLHDDGTTEDLGGAAADEYDLTRVRVLGTIGAGRLTITYTTDKLGEQTMALDMPAVTAGYYFVGRDGLPRWYPTWAPLTMLSQPPALAKEATLGTPAGASLAADIAAIAAAAGDPVGSGADAVTLTVTDANGDPVADAEVWITSDLDGTTVVAGTLRTGDDGRTTTPFMLTAGETYYAWRRKAGINFTNPVTFVAAAD